MTQTRFQEGVSGPAGSANKDTYLDDGNPTTNFGTNVDLIFGKQLKAADVRRAILEFNISSLPASQSIQETSQLRIKYGTQVGGLPCVIERLTRTDWVEAEATWDDYRSGNAWTAAGGDFTTDLSVGFTVPSLPGFFRIGSVGDVELTGGASGSVDGITVDGVQIMSGAESFDTDLLTTAGNVKDNINAHTSTPNYTATSEAGAGSNGRIIIIPDVIMTGILTVVTSVTTITKVDTNLDMDSGPELAALLQDAVDMRSGIVRMLVKVVNEATANGEGWKSSDFGTAADRPELIVEHVAAPTLPTGTLGLLGVGR